MYSNLRRTKGWEASVSRGSSCAFEKWMPFNRRPKSIWARALVHLLLVVISVQLRCVALVHSHAYTPVWPYTAWTWVCACGSCTSAQVSSPLKRAGICNMHSQAWRRESAGTYVRCEKPGSKKADSRTGSLRKTYACVFWWNRTISNDIWLYKFISLNEINFFYSSKFCM